VGEGQKENARNLLNIKLPFARIAAAMRPLAAAALAALAAAQQPVSPIWPLPTGASTFGSTKLNLSPSFSISCSGVCPDPLPAAFSRYLDIIFLAGPPTTYPNASTPTLPSLVVAVSSSSPLTLLDGLDESYALVVPGDGKTPATLTAPTQWGALRGLESFAQLVAWDAAGSGSPTYTLPFAPASVADAPRWPWRSLLLDTARHFLPLPYILTTLDGMAANKLNVLHWHVVDDESWPLYSATLPLLTQSAFSPDAIYTHADVQTVVRYAWERGITVIPEFDMPAHATAFGGGYPNLVISCDEVGGQTLLNPVPAASLPPSSAAAPAPPTPPDIYAVVDALLAEFLPLFASPDAAPGAPSFVHLGGDEVRSLACWNSSAEVQNYMKRAGLATVDAVRNAFQVRVQQIANARNATVVFWEEVFDLGYDLLPTTVVDVWLSFEELAAVTGAGHRVVSSYGSYLNQQKPFGYNTYAYQDTWKAFYTLSDPTTNQTLTPAQQALVVGLSVSQWVIQTDAANLFANTWPRSAALAERAWSPRAAANTTAAEPRLEAWRCALTQRGVPSGPLVSSYCPLPDGGVGVEFGGDWQPPVRRHVADAWRRRARATTAS
jgi:hexosaminidase